MLRRRHKHIAFFPPITEYVISNSQHNEEKMRQQQWNIQRPFSGQTNKIAKKKKKKKKFSVHPSVFPSALQWVGPTSTGCSLCPHPLNQVQWTCWMYEPRLPPLLLSTWRVWPSLQGRLRLPSSPVRTRPEQPAEGRQLAARERPRSDHSPNIRKKNKLIKTFLGGFAALLTATCRPHLSGQCTWREPFLSLWNHQLNSWRV